MNEQEIFDYNKRCALFLGWKETTDEFKINWLGCKTKERLDRTKKEYIPILEKDGDVLFQEFTGRDFYNDWHWIHEVIDAIEDIRFTNSGESIYSMTICDKVCSINAVNKEILWVRGRTKKIAAIEAINRFLILYNNKSI
jgi:hypothetical protein